MRKENPLISVIVPVYNVEPYINRCVSSILSQTQKNYELILVDDGSPDNCGAICDEFLDIDPRVKVIHKQNGGVSSARNAGIDIASGEWLCFVDGDDWIDDNYLFDFGIEDNYDLLLQGYREIAPQGTVIKTHQFSSNNLSPSSILIEAELQNIINSPCFKLYKRSIVVDNMIQFNPGISFGEDYVFTYEYLQHAYCFKLGKGMGYNVNRGIEGSLSNRIVPFDQMLFFTEKIYSLQLKMVDRFGESSNELMRVFNQKRYLNIRKMISDSAIKGLDKREMTIIQSIIHNSNNLRIRDIGGKHFLFLMAVSYMPFFLIKKVV